MLYLINFNGSGSSAEVQLKMYWSIFDCAKMELLQVNFSYTLNILHLKTDAVLLKKHTLITRET